MTRNKRRRLRNMRRLLAGKWRLYPPNYGKPAWAWIASLISSRGAVVLPGSFQESIILTARTDVREGQTVKITKRGQVVPA